MSNLTIRIGGRDFTVACAQGEEAHIDTLGRMIDGRLSELGEEQRGMSETRTLLFAALLLADDLYDLRAKAAPLAASPAPDPALAAQIDTLAQRLENIAAHLEETAPNA
jgi:cell division protein ZapA